MQSGTEFIISEERGKKLQLLLKSPNPKRFINLDGRGMIVSSNKIISVTEERVKQDTPETAAWKRAIAHNLKTMRETGRMGKATASDFLNKSAVATG